MSNQKGFTLIELLIVVVIISLLASIAVPKFSATKDKAKMASVRSDLRNVMTAQEAYFADYNAFGDLLQLQAASNFGLSSGNTGTVTTSASGYTAVVENLSIAAGPTQCQVEYGGGVTAAVDGVMICN